MIHLQQYLHSFCNSTFRGHCSKDNMSIVFCSSLWNNVILLQTHLSLAFSHDKLTSFLDLSVKVPHAERLIQTDPGAQIRQNSNALEMRKRDLIKISWKDPFLEMLFGFFNNAKTQCFTFTKNVSCYNIGRQKSPVAPTTFWREKSNASEHLPYK